MPLVVACGEEKKRKIEGMREVIDFLVGQGKMKTEEKNLFSLKKHPWCSGAVGCVISS